MSREQTSRGGNAYYASNNQNFGADQNNNNKITPGRNTYVFSLLSFLVNVNGMSSSVIINDDEDRIGRTGLEI